VRTAGLQQAFAAPEDTDSVREVARELSALVGKEGVLAFMERAARRADLDIPAAGGWLLARAASEGTVDVARLAETYHLDEDRLRAVCRDLHERQLLTGGPDGSTGLTPEGARAVDALADARCAALEDLAADWSPAEHPELARYVEQLSDDLAEEPPRTAAASA
jgi:hypothetical protein